MKTVKTVSLSVLLILTMLIGVGFAQEHNEEEGEGGTRYSKSKKLDEVKRGVHLVLMYESASQTFVGTIKNVSNKPVTRARVEIHLSNKVELGPTTPTTIEPGKQITIKLPAKGQKFEWWTAHAEVGSAEGGHGEGSEGGGEHGRSERGEHEGERGEHAEGGEGHEEGEGHEGGEGGEGGDGRSGAITSLGKRFKGIINEFEVDMFYDAKTMSVTGTIKNISSKKIFSVQTEHHLKLGKRTVAEMKTTKVGDLNPGEMRKTTAPIREKDRSRLTNGTFDGYVIHIEVLGPNPHREGVEGREGKSIK